MMVCDHDINIPISLSHISPLAQIPKKILISWVFAYIENFVYNLIYCDKNFLQ